MKAFLSFNCCIRNFLVERKDAELLQIASLKRIAEYGGQISITDHMPGDQFKMSDVRYFQYCLFTQSLL